MLSSQSLQTLFENRRYKEIVLILDEHFSGPDKDSVTYAYKFTNVVSIDTLGFFCVFFNNFSFFSLLLLQVMLKQVSMICLKPL